LKGTPKDPRSTQRKRARALLFRLRIPYICADCGKSPKLRPGDAPKDLELAPRYLRTVSGLQANHINKDIMDNDLANLEWLCPSCHKLKDKQTAKGVSLKEDEWGYGLEDLI
jgi:ribosomal protein L37AE/L43A